MLTWNLPNWITVVLMASLGYLLFGAIAAALSNGAGSGAPGASAAGT